MHRKGGAAAEQTQRGQGGCAAETEASAVGCAPRILAGGRIPQQALECRWRTPLPTWAQFLRPTPLEMQGAPVAFVPFRAEGGAKRVFALAVYGNKREPTIVT